MRDDAWGRMSRSFLVSISPLVADWLENEKLTHLQLDTKWQDMRLLLDVMTKNIQITRTFFLLQNCRTVSHFERVSLPRWKCAAKLRKGAEPNELVCSWKCARRRWTIEILPNETSGRNDWGVLGVATGKNGHPDTQTDRRTSLNFEKFKFLQFRTKIKFFETISLHSDIRKFAIFWNS